MTMPNPAGQIKPALNAKFHYRVITAANVVAMSQQLVINEVRDNGQRSEVS